MHSFSASISRASLRCVGRRQRGEACWLRLEGLEAEAEAGRALLGRALQLDRSDKVTGWRAVTLFAGSGLVASLLIGQWHRLLTDPETYDPGLFQLFFGLAWPPPRLAFSDIPPPSLLKPPPI